MKNGIGMKPNAIYESLNRNDENNKYLEFKRFDETMSISFMYSIDAILHTSSIQTRSFRRNKIVLTRTFASSKNVG